jgi:hypothetical protein
MALLDKPAVAHFELLLFPLFQAEAGGWEQGSNCGFQEVG